MSLDKRIQAIFSRAGSEVVDAIRASLADEIRRLTSGTSTRGVTEKRNGKRRSSKQIASGVERLLGFIRQHPGLRTEEILKQLGGDKITIKDGLARLRATGKVRTTGIKRAMTYRAA